MRRILQGSKSQTCRTVIRNALQKIRYSLKGSKVQGRKPREWSQEMKSRRYDEISKIKRFKPAEWSDSSRSSDTSRTRTASSSSAIGASSERWAGRPGKKFFLSLFLSLSLSPSTGTRKEGLVLSLKERYSWEFCKFCSQTKKRRRGELGCDGCRLRNGMNILDWSIGTVTWLCRLCDLGEGSRRLESRRMRD